MSDQTPNLTALTEMPAADISVDSRPPTRMADDEQQQVIRITHLRDCLGVAYLHVKNTDEPIVIRRYKDQDVALVPLWEWRFLKQIEARSRAGECPWEEEFDEPDNA